MLASLWKLLPWMDYTADKNDNDSKLQIAISDTYSD